VSGAPEPAVAGSPPFGPALRRFWGFLRPQRTGLVVLGLSVLGLRGLSLPLPLLYREIVDRALPQREGGLLLGLIVALAALLLATRVLGFVLQVLSTRIQQAVLHHVRLRLYAHLQRMDLGFFRRHSTGGLLSRILSDAAQVQSVLSRQTFEVLAGALQLVVVGGLLLWLQPRLALLCAGVLPVLLGLVALFQRRIYRLSRALQEQREALSARLQENLAGVRLIQALSLEERQLEATRATSAALRDTVTRGEVLGSGVNLLTLTLTDLPLTLFVWGVGGLLVLRDELSLGGLLAFYQYLMMLYDPVLRLLRFHLQLQAARASLDRLFEILDSPPAVRDRPDAQPLRAPHGHLRCEGLSLRYGPDQPAALRSLDLELQPGEVLGLVGPSGAGKTTLINGLLRFLEPCAGRILLDGQDLADVRLDSLRRKIGLVSQETFLFADTVRANVALARPGASEEELRRAAAAAQATDFIEALPQGWDTVLGEGGAGLSGGERQRLALARVFLQDPPLLLLDEATSALDARSEELVQRALACLLRGRSAIVVAHRFSTLRSCDRVAVLSGGRLVEQGRAAELAARGGLYRELLAAQVLDLPPAPGPAPERAP